MLCINAAVVNINPRLHVITASVAVQLYTPSSICQRLWRQIMLICCYCALFISYLINLLQWACLIMIYELILTTRTQMFAVVNEEKGVSELAKLVC